MRLRGATVKLDVVLAPVLACIIVLWPASGGVATGGGV
jgi:hypothetical protein